MELVLVALGIAFTALCVWLAVRIVNRRERWAKWTLAGVVALPVLYFATFGPACWYIARRSHDVPFYNQQESDPWFTEIYWPIGMAAEEEDQFFQTVVFRYGMLGVKNQVCEVQLPTSREGTYLLMVPD